MAATHVGSGGGRPGADRDAGGSQVAGGGMAADTVRGGGAAQGCAGGIGGGCYSFSRGVAALASS